MINRITKGTWDLWVENMAYLMRSADPDKQYEDIAEDIMQYLENEGAFDLVE